MPKPKEHKRTTNRIFIDIAFWGFVIVAVVYCAMAFTGYLVDKNDNLDYNPDLAVNRVEVEVFNGCKNSRVTQEIVHLLRHTGKIDVINIEQTTGNIYPRTIILDRHGNEQVIKTLGEILEIGGDRILAQKSNQFLDATIVIGTDYRTLVERLKQKVNL